MGFKKGLAAIRQSINTRVTAKVTTRLATDAPLAANTYDNGNQGVDATITANVNGILPDIDGVTAIVDNRILVKDEVAELKNGFYDVTSVGSAGSKWVLTRSVDADQNSEVGVNTNAFVSEGTANADTLFSLTTDGVIDIGTTALTFESAASAFDTLAEILANENTTSGVDILMTGTDSIGFEDQDEGPGNYTVLKASTIASQLEIRDFDGELGKLKLDILVYGDFNSSLLSTTSAFRSWTLPDASGTIALLSDLTAQNELSEILANGNTTGAFDLFVTAGQKIRTDQISETTLDAGVTIDGLKIENQGTYIELTDAAKLAMIEMNRYEDGATSITSDAGGFVAGGAFYVSPTEASLYWDGSFIIQVSGTATSITTAAVGGGGIRIDSGGMTIQTGPTENLGFYGKTPIALQAQIIDFKDAIVNLGLIASAGGATPLDLDGGTLTSPLIQGNTIASGTLTLSSTLHATKGKILFGTSAYDEVNNRLGIGTAVPNTTLDVTGVGGASVGGFASGALHVTSTSAAVNANAVITGHNLFGGNKQLWYFGSVSSSNDNIAIINRQNADLTFHTNNIERLKITADGLVQVDNLQLDGNTISTTTGDLDITTASGGVFKYVSNAFQAGQDASNYLEIGHGGSNSFVNQVGTGGIDFRFAGTTKATFTSSGHLHLLTDTDQKHNLKLKTSDNLKDTGIAWENSGGNFSQTIFRADVGSNRSDLFFAIGSNADIDLLTDAIRIDGSAANEGNVEFFKNVGIGTANFGTNAAIVLGQKNGTAPTTSPADIYQQYSADIVAGNAAPHFRTENGDVIKLFKGTALTAIDATVIDATYDATEQAVLNNIRIRLNEMEARFQAAGQLA